MTEEGFDDLIRGKHSRVIQAEQSAEMTLLEYLKQNYEIEKILDEGKHIPEYNAQITYPANVCFRKDSQIWRTLISIKGIKRPSSIIFWREITAEDSELQYDLDKIAHYSQMATYKNGDIVSFQNKSWQCLAPNGQDFNDIRIPGINAWKEANVEDWEAIKDYKLWDVVRYKNRYYTLIKLDDLDKTDNPYDSNNWGLIGDYDDNYQYELSDHEYIVYENKVYYPIITPNGDIPTEHKNIIEDDPRNPNIIRHMVRIALYELHKLISPTNISNVRINDYNESIQWLKDASHFKLDPQIPRKIDESDNLPKTNFQIATFSKPLDPYENEWLI